MSGFLDGSGRYRYPDLGQAAFQEGALRGVRRESHRVPVRLSGAGGVTEAAQEVGAGGGKVGVVGEPGIGVQLVEERQGGSRTVRERHGDGPIQRDDRDAG